MKNILYNLCYFVGAILSLIITCLCWGFIWKIITLSFKIGYNALPY